MKKYSSFLIASVLALLVAGALTFRITSRKAHFDKVVREALSTSEGYDQRFIDMVNRLENELALRASFGYIGQKDPLTGKERFVVPYTAPKRRIGRNPQPTVARAPDAAPAPVDVDNVKLTAIIFDDTKSTYTAIIMDGERSFATDVGDKVAGRTITRITQDRIFMEDNSFYYFYDITGNKGKKAKDGAVQQ